MKVRPKRMEQGVKLTNFYSEEPGTAPAVPLPQAELKHYQHVIGNVTQDALDTWAELWGELQQGMCADVTVVPKADGDSAVRGEDPVTVEPFKPSCGWPEFMEKMWILRHYLDFLARFSRQ